MATNSSWLQCRHSVCFVKRLFRTTSEFFPSDSPRIVSETIVSVANLSEFAVRRLGLPARHGPARCGPLVREQRGPRPCHVARVDSRLLHGRFWRIRSLCDQALRRTWSLPTPPLGQARGRGDEATTRLFGSETHSECDHVADSVRSSCLTGSFRRGLGCLRTRG